MAGNVFRHMGDKEQVKHRHHDEGTDRGQE